VIHGKISSLYGKILKEDAPLIPTCILTRLHHSTNFVQLDYFSVILLSAQLCSTEVTGNSLFRISSIRATRAAKEEG
jgi:hypothetical protein